MAIYHASFQIVKRSAGRSSVAAAAYRSGKRLIDERTGEIHDYTRKGGVASTFIMTPDNAPAWAADRQQLWTAVELGEKRKDAQLARELNVALPKELSRSESSVLLREYIQSSFVDQGMVADVALHNMDSENPHAHVMLSMRDIDEDGFGKKNRDWNNKTQLAQWREGWATVTNKHLKANGHSERIDHRSLADQGIERLPTVHLGASASAMEERGISTFKGEYNRKAFEVNEVLAKVGADIKQRVQSLRDTLSPTEFRDRLLGSLDKHGSVLKQILDEKEQQRMQERKQEIERDRDKGGPSLGY